MRNELYAIIPHRWIHLYKISSPLGWIFFYSSTLTGFIFARAEEIFKRLKAVDHFCLRSTLYGPQFLSPKILFIWFFFQTISLFTSILKVFLVALTVKENKGKKCNKKKKQKRLRMREHPFLCALENCTYEGWQNDEECDCVIHWKSSLPITVYRSSHICLLEHWLTIVLIGTKERGTNWYRLDLISSCIWCTDRNQKRLLVIDVRFRTEIEGLWWPSTFLPFRRKKTVLHCLSKMIPAPFLSDILDNTTRK